MEAVVVTRGFKVLILSAKLMLYALARGTSVVNVEVVTRFSEPYAMKPSTCKPVLSYTPLVY